MEGLRHRYLLLPCSGACSVGQLSHQAAVDLTAAGFGRMGSLAGIAAGIPAAIAEAGQCRTVVAIDGCASACCRHILDRAGIGCAHHLIITTLGLDRLDRLEVVTEDLQLVKDAIEACCAEARPIVHLGGCTCGL